MFNERLKETRELFGWSQQQMAEKMNVSLRTQQNYEAGKREPDASYLTALTLAGGDVIYILTGQRNQTAIPVLRLDEAALLDNYRNASKEQQKILKATSAAFAQQICKRAED